MKSSKQAASSDLLRQTTSYDIGVLIDDLELSKDGYVISYIIDPYDIFRFSFPYGLKFDQSHRSINEIGDEMIAYSYVFEKYDPVILDEYKLELFVTRNNVYKDISRHVDSNLFDKLEKRLRPASPEEKKEIYKELEESATFLLSSALLTESFINHLDTNLKKLQIDTFELKARNEKHEQIILKTFRENTRSFWSANAFKNWVKEKDESRYFEHKTPSKISTELKTTYRDYVVIDRICNINKHLQELQENGDIDGKYLFLYFSSATKSREIFGKNKIDKIKDHLPTIIGKDKRYEKFNILRSAKHAFLLFLLSDQDQDEAIKYLERLRETAIKHEATSLGDFPNNVEDSLSKIKEKKRDRFEEVKTRLQIQTHEKYKESLLEKIQTLQNARGDLSKLRKLYEGLLEKAKIVRFNIDPLMDMEMNYSIQSGLSILLKLLASKKDLNLHKGLDLIEGNYQHLPVLLFLNNQQSINSKLRNLLNEVIDFVVKSPKIRKEALSDFCKKIEELYATSESLYTAADKTEREDIYYPGILIKSLIYLMLPFKGDLETQEREVFSFIFATFTELQLAENAEEERLRDLYVLFAQRERSFKKWQDDYRYFLIWAARRKKDFPRSLEEAEAAIKHNDRDPRFHHGKCLALHNLYTEDNLKVEDFDRLEPLVESAEKALKLYAKMIAGTHNTAPHFVEGSIAALQNTILYAVLLTHLNSLEKGTSEEFLNNPKLSKYKLENLREDLWGPIEAYEKKQKRKFTDLPEYDQTLSILELCEAISLFNGTHFPEAEEKIKEAFDAIDAAIDIDRKSDLYKNTRTKVEEWQVRIDAVRSK